MTILDEKRFRPESIEQLRKYIRIEIEYEFQSYKGMDADDAEAVYSLLGDIGYNYKVDYYLFSEKEVIPDEDMYVRNDVIEDDITTWDLNKIQLDYAITNYVKRMREYEVVNNESNRIKLDRKISFLKNAIEDLRDWFIEDKGVPEIYYSVAEYFNIENKRTPQEIINSGKSNTQIVVELVNLALRSPESDAQAFNDFIKDRNNYSRIISEKFLQRRGENRLTKQDLCSGAMIWYNNKAFKKKRDSKK
jgi:hypothetical protein